MKIRLGRPGDGRCKNIIQIDEWDTWSMDWTLAPILLPMLIQLKKTKHGTPCSMPAFEEDEKYPYEWSEETSEKALQQWNDILDKMIWSFTQLSSEDKGEDQFWIKKPDFPPKRDNLPDGSILWKPSGKLDNEGLKAHYVRIQEGLELFGKHFQDLWD